MISLTHSLLPKKPDSMSVYCLCIAVVRLAMMLLVAHLKDDT